MKRSSGLVSYLASFLNARLQIAFDSHIDVIYNLHFITLSRHPVVSYF